jgi:signal transduction histidine kinase
VNSIGDDADRLLKITSELINMAQVETGNIQFNLQPTPIPPIINEAIDAVQIQAQQKNITIRSNLPPELPMILADREKTTWVLINFLTNAIKYSFESSMIEIQVALKNNMVTISVKDHGRGIDEKYLPKVFDRYFRSRVPMTLQDRPGSRHLQGIHRSPGWENMGDQPDR